MNFWTTLNFIAVFVLAVRVARREDKEFAAYLITVGLMALNLWIGLDAVLK